MNRIVSRHNTPEERGAHLARQIVIAKLTVRTPISPITDPYFPLKPDESDFLGPFRVWLRIELIMVRIDQAEIDGNPAAADEYRKELVQAEQEWIRMML